MKGFKQSIKIQWNAGIIIFIIGYENDFDGKLLDMTKIEFIQSYCHYNGLFL